LPPKCEAALKPPPDYFPAATAPARERERERERERAKGTIFNSAPNTEKLSASQQQNSNGLGDFLSAMRRTGVFCS
jgi:hypothetical protein